MRWFLVFSLFLLALAVPGTATETGPSDEVDHLDWPRTMTLDEVTYVIHQPQIESWDRYHVKAQSAVSITEAGEENPAYGVMSLEARTRVDKEERLVTFDRLEITNASFPSAPDQAERYLRLLQERVKDKVRVISLDHFEASLQVVEAVQEGRQTPVKNQPPRVIFSETPAMLVSVDGEAVYQPIEKSKYQRVINTRVLILRGEDGTHFLHLFDGWMAAPDLEGPWAVADKTPWKLKKARKKTVEQHPADLMEGEKEDESGKKVEQPSLKKGPVPTVVVSTVPAELIVFDGEPEYIPVWETSLLYVDNTTGNVFKHIGDQKSYLLISGRWFSAPSLDGPWSHVTQNDLPPTFGDIPDDSPKENVKASVAGTAQAMEAMIANSIPQTAEVDRKKASFKAEYDGEPHLEPIEGTPLFYVANSPVAVIMVDANASYALQDGVWFQGPSVNGPWEVATEVPAVIYSIPASSPLHNVTYVKIYESTPEVIVVGYTPGYYGTVVVDEVVVYGTGYVYSPWVGSSWYGYPCTYGYGCAATYTPWGGWAYTFGVGWGWGYWGSPWWGPYPYPYWGPYYGYGYYPYGGVAYGAYGGAVVWGPGGWAGTTGNVYHHWGSTGAVTRTSGGYNAWTGTGWRNQVGASYNSRTGTLAAGQRAAVGNVYTGDYAYGKRGVAGNKEAGIVAAGKSGTAGNIYTGNEVSAGRGAIHNSNTGETTRVGGISGEQGKVVRVGDDIYGSKDGEVYRRSDGGWEEMNPSGDWKGVSDQARTKSLDQQQKARSTGSQRYQGYQRSQSYRGSSMRGSYGGARGGGARRGGGRRR